MTFSKPGSKFFQKTRTFDRTQIDLKPNQKSGLEDAIGILKNVKGIGFVELDHKDVVRHQIVKEIIKAYGKSEGKS